MRMIREGFRNLEYLKSYVRENNEKIKNCLYTIVMSSLKEEAIKEYLLSEFPMGKWCFIKSSVYGEGIELFIFLKDEEIHHETFKEELDESRREIVEKNLFEEGVFIRRLQLEIAAGSGGLRAVVIVDIDDFKSVNNAIGYTGGDVLLHILTCRLSAVLPDYSFFTRLYGDKYIIFVKNMTEKKIDVWLKKVLRIISIPIIYGEHEFYVTASIGVYRLENEIKRANEVLKRADIALSWAKRRGRNCIAFYEEEMSKYESERLEKLNTLMRMYKNKDFYLVYQPILCLRSNVVKGFEVLMRCKNINSEKLCMQDTITFMEEMGFIYEVGKWLIEEAFKQMVVWNKHGNNESFVSINISAVQMQNSRFLEDLREIISKTGVETSKIFFEITETSMLSDLHLSSQLIGDLKKLGIKVSIDDFGTGYSSFSYLKSLKADGLKIDKSFIKHIDQHYADLAIVKAIVSLGHNLGMKVVAEGVETEKQMCLLKEIGCDYVQGFFVSPPLSNEEAYRFAYLK